MAPNPLSWAAIAGKNMKKPSSQSPTPRNQNTMQQQEQQKAPQSPTPTLTSPTSPSPLLAGNLQPTIPTDLSPKPPRVAFISGHIDITPLQFHSNYAHLLDSAILAGDSFVLSNAGGVDTLALAYLRSKSVSPSRTTIYMHRARENRKRLNETQKQINAMRLGPEVEARYMREGYKWVVVNGHHNERDAAMTEASDYDILWVRGEEDTKVLYGEKYRAGRVSGTQKNRDRRAAKQSIARMKGM